MERLEEFQSEYNAISIEDQARAVIGAAAGMQTEAMELEIVNAMGLILSGLDSAHDRVKEAPAGDRLLREEMPWSMLRDGLEVGGSDLLRSKTLQLELDENLFLPLKQIPGVAQEFATREKDVLVQKALLQLLLQQEAEALIEAKNTTSTVQVLDPAVAPEIKARPQAAAHHPHHRGAQPFRLAQLYPGDGVRAGYPGSAGGRSGGKPPEADPPVLDRSEPDPGTLELAAANPC